MTSFCLKGKRGTGVVCILDQGHEGNHSDGNGWEWDDSEVISKKEADLELVKALGPIGLLLLAMEYPVLDEMARRQEHDDER